MVGVSFVFLLSLWGCGQDLQAPLSVSSPSLGASAEPKVDTVCSGTGTYSTIQAAINALPTGSTITICAGTYKERLTLSGKALTFTGAGASTTIVDANASGSALTLSGGATAKVSGLKFINAKTSGIHCTSSTLRMSASTVDSNKGSKGAGLYATGCRVVVSTSTFSNNTASSRGGGAYVISSTGKFYRNTFSGNKSSSRGGGLAVATTAMTVDQNTFSSNTATHGGGLWIDNDTDVTKNTFSGNTVTYHGGGMHTEGGDGDITTNAFRSNIAGEDGGGLYVDSAAPYIGSNTFTDNEAVDDAGGLRLLTSEAVVTGNTFTGNSCGDSGGGAKVSHKYSTFTDNVFEDNVAVTYGGGLVLDEDTSTLTDTVFSGNSATAGGGLHILGGWRPVEIVGAEFTDNTADTRGAAIAVELTPYGVEVSQALFDGNVAPNGAAISMSGSDLELANAVVSGNAASVQGGGLHLTDSPMAVVNTVFYGNSSPSGSALYLSGASGTGVRNSVFNANTGGYATVLYSGTLAWAYNNHYGQTGGDFSGLTVTAGTDGNLNTTPGFTSATTGDFSLTTTSGLVDKGDPAAAYNDANGTRNDMGAFGGPEGSGW